MNSAVQVLTRTPQSTLRLTQSVPAPVELFEAWTLPAVMADWYARRMNLCRRPSRSICVSAATRWA